MEIWAARIFCFNKLEVRQAVRPLMLQPFSPSIASGTIRKMFTTVFSQSARNRQYIQRWAKWRALSCEKYQPIPLCPFGKLFWAIFWVIFKIYWIPTLVPFNPAEKLMDRSALSYCPLLSSQRGDSFRKNHMGTMRAFSTDPYHQMTRQSWVR